MDKSSNLLDLVRVKSIIDNFDFGYVVDRALRTGMPPEVAPRALAEFKTFLFAHAAHPKVPLVPQSHRCDTLWHEFIVADTRAYFHFCEAAFGHYLHHDGVNATPAEHAEHRTRSAKLLGATTAACYGSEELPVECGLSVECGIALSAQPLPGRSERVVG